jgi:hypothetical protein
MPSDEVASVPAREPPRSDPRGLQETLPRLLAAYGGALRFASGMRFVEHFAVASEQGEGKRWASRFWTLAYTQAHVHGRLRRIAELLSLQLLLDPEGDSATWYGTQRAEIKEQLASPTTWGRLRAIFARLPPVTAAVAILLTAIGGFVQGKSFDTSSAIRAFVVLGVTAGVLWLLILWPSIRLGFRIKRAIFAGSIDLQHPLGTDPGSLEWEGFPSADVYRLEREAFSLLKSRPPSEAPLDMLLSLPPYFFLSASIFLWVIAIGLARQHEWAELAKGVWLPILLTIFLGVVGRNAPRNYKNRCRGSEALRKEREARGIATIILRDMQSNEG